MAVVPECKHDMFVSYAHIDDTPIVEESGWVSTIVDQLQQLLTRLLDSLPQCSPRRDSLVSVPA